MLTKDKLVSSLKAMPEGDFKDIDVLIEQIIVLEKIEKAEADISQGKTIT